MADSDRDGQVVPFRVGSIVMGNWQGQGHWYLGRIIDVCGDKYMIRYVDGDWELMSPDDLRHGHSDMHTGDHVARN